MRRIIQIILLLTLVMIGLVACGGANSPSTTLNDEQASPVDDVTFTPPAETDAVRRPQFLNAYADW